MSIQAMSAICRLRTYWNCLCESVLVNVSDKHYNSCTYL
jgi:hypothetical protein